MAEYYPTTGVPFDGMPLGALRDPVLTGMGSVEEIGNAADQYRTLADALEKASEDLRAVMNAAQGAHEGEAAAASRQYVMRLAAVGELGAAQSRISMGALHDGASYYARARDDMHALVDTSHLVDPKTNGPVVTSAQQLEEMRVLAVEAEQRYERNTNAALQRQFQPYEPEPIAPPGVIGGGAGGGPGVGAGAAGVGGPEGGATAAGAGTGVAPSEFAGPVGGPGSTAGGGVGAGGAVPAGAGAGVGSGAGAGVVPGAGAVGTVPGGVGTGGAGTGGVGTGGAGAGSRGAASGVGRAATVPGGAGTGPGGAGGGTAPGRGVRVRPVARPGRDGPGVRPRCAPRPRDRTRIATALRTPTGGTREWADPAPRRAGPDGSRGPPGRAGPAPVTRVRVPGGPAGAEHPVGTRAARGRSRTALRATGRFRRPAPRPAAARAVRVATAARR